MSIEEAIEILYKERAIYKECDSDKTNIKVYQALLLGIKALGEIKEINRKWYMQK